MVEAIVVVLVYRNQKWSPKRRQSMDSEESNFARLQVLGAGLIRLGKRGKAQESAGKRGPGFPSGEIWGIFGDISHVT
jgi:hypothetical protein